MAARSAGAGPDWQMIGAIAGVVAIPVSILIGVATCATGSNNSTPPTTEEGGSGHVAAPDAAPPPEQLWPGEPDGAGYKTGTTTLYADNLGASNSLDLDTSREHYGIDDRSDLVPTTAGVGADKGAQVALWSGSQPPTLHECRQLPDAEYSNTELLDTEHFQTTTRYCVKSNEERVGRIQTISADLAPNGNTNSYTFTYVLWKKPGDK